MGFMMQFLYLDYNAAATLDPGVIAATAGLRSGAG